MKFKQIRIGHSAYKDENALFVAGSKAAATRELIGRGFKRVDIRNEFKRLEARLAEQPDGSIYNYIRSGHLSCEIGITL